MSKQTVNNAPRFRCCQFPECRVNSLFILVPFTQHMRRWGEETDRGLKIFFRRAGSLADRFFALEQLQVSFVACFVLVGVKGGESFFLN